MVNFSIRRVDVETVKDFISCGDLAAVGSEKALVRKCDLDRFLGIDNEADACAPVETTNEENNMVDIKHGDGSVYLNKRRNCFQAAFYLTQPDGTRVRKIVSGKTTVEAIGKMEMAKAAFSRPAASAQSVYYLKRKNLHGTEAPISFPYSGKYFAIEFQSQLLKGL